MSNKKNLLIAVGGFGLFFFLEGITQQAVLETFVGLLLWLIGFHIYIGVEDGK